MTTYEVMYKCYLPVCCYSLVPQIYYKYRKCGKILWKKKRVDIDRFAMRHWKKGYYDGRLVVPNLIPEHERMCIIRDVINNEYDGSLKNYVKAMVEYEIMSELIEQSGDYETMEISLSFVTNGWKRTTVRLERKDIKDEELD